MECQSKATRIGLVGERGSGKTSFLIDLVKAYRNAGLKVEGILSPGIFEGREKVAIEMTDLARGQSRLLARLAMEAKGDFQYGDWVFNEETIAWANRLLASIVDPDVIIVDELGPLEFELSRGLQAGLKLLSKDSFLIGVTTVRPKCLNALEMYLPAIQVFPFEISNRDTLKESILRIV